MSWNLRVRVAVIIAAMGSGLISRSVSAAPCDDADDAWRAVDLGLAAQRHGDPHAAESAVAALTDVHCTPSGTHSDLIARARLEARLLVLELHADAARAGLAQMPRQTSPGGEGFRRWMRRAITPWLTTQLASVRAVTNETTPLVAAASADPGIAADAIAALISLEMDLANAVDRVPVPEELQRDPELMRAYREMIQSNTQSIVDSVRDGYRAIATRAQREALVPREARRVEAYLLLRGRITAADRANAPRSASSARPASSAAPHGSVEPGAVRAEGDASVSPQAVRDVVEASMPALIECHEHGLDRVPTLHGDVTLRFVIAPDGRASQMQVTRGDGPLREVAQCIGETLRGLTFPTARAPLTIDYPFHLEPGPPASNTTLP